MKSFVMLCHFRETLRGDEGQTDLSLFDFLQFSDSDFTDKCDSYAGLAVEESHGRPLQSSFSVGTFGSQADSTVNSSLWRCLVRTFVVSPSASQQRRLDPWDDEHCFLSNIINLTYFLCKLIYYGGWFLLRILGVWKRLTVFLFYLQPVHSKQTINASIKEQRTQRPQRRILCHFIHLLS